MKKSLIFVALAASSFIFAQTGSVGINTATPDASSALDVSSANKGMLVPRMASTARQAIQTPANGLLVYDTTTNSFWVYKNTLWVEVITGLPTITTKTSNYSVTSADNGKILEFNSAVDVTCVIPSGLPAGFQISVTQLGSGRVNFVGSGVILNNAYGYNKTAFRYSKAGVEVSSTNEVIISGDLR